MWASQLLGSTYLAKGDEARGKELLNMVIANATTTTVESEKPYAVGAINSLNNADIKTKNFQGIVERSKIGTQISPKNTMMWLFLGIGYQGTKNLDEAKKAYQTVLEIDPGNQMAKKNLQSLGR
jgi:lipoprotein NlpI